MEITTVESGEYMDHQILAVFADPADAQKFADDHNRNLSGGSDRAFLGTLPYYPAGTYQTPPPPVLAILGGMDGNRLTNDSTVTIEGVTYPIPPRVPLHGGGTSRIAPMRIGHTIHEAGYRQAPRDAGFIGEDGTFPVEKI